MSDENRYGSDIMASLCHGDKTKQTGISLVVVVTFFRL